MQERIDLASRLAFFREICFAIRMNTSMNPHEKIGQAASLSVSTRQCATRSARDSMSSAPLATLSLSLLLAIGCRA